MLMLISDPRWFFQKDGIGGLCAEALAVAVAKSNKAANKRYMIAPLAFASSPRFR